MPGTVGLQGACSKEKLCLSPGRANHLLNTQKPPEANHRHKNKNNTLIRAWSIWIYSGKRQARWDSEGRGREMFIETETSMLVNSLGEHTNRVKVNANTVY